MGGETDWAGVYKFLRLAVLALVLVGIGIWVYWPSRRRRLEEPARRMLEEDGPPGEAPR